MTWPLIVAHLAGAWAGRGSSARFRLTKSAQHSTHHTSRMESSFRGKFDLAESGYSPQLGLSKTSGLNAPSRVISILVPSRPPAPNPAFSCQTTNLHDPSGARAIV